MTTVVARILDDLVTDLTGISGVDLVTADPARLIAREDDVAIMVEWEPEAGGIDSEPDACSVDASLPVLITIYVPRGPSSAPSWQLLDPYYAEVHRRVMADRRRGGLAVDTRSVSREPLSATQECGLRCRYSVQYRTRQGDVELQ